MEWEDTLKSAGYTFIHTHLNLHMNLLSQGSKQKQKQNQVADLHLQGKQGLRTAWLKRSLVNEETGGK